MDKITSNLVTAAALLALRVKRLNELKIEQRKSGSMIKIEANNLLDIFTTQKEIRILSDHIIDHMSDADKPLGLIEVNPSISIGYQDKLYGIFKLAKQSSFEEFCNTLSENNLSINI